VIQIVMTRKDTTEFHLRDSQNVESVTRIERRDRTLQHETEFRIVALLLLTSPTAIVRQGRLGTNSPEINIVRLRFMVSRKLKLPDPLTSRLAAITQYAIETNPMEVRGSQGHP